MRTLFWIEPLKDQSNTLSLIFKLRLHQSYVRVRSSACSELGARFRWINSDMIKKDKVDVGMSALALKLINDRPLG